MWLVEFPTTSPDDVLLVYAFPPDRLSFGNDAQTSQLPLGQSWHADQEIAATLSGMSSEAVLQSIRRTTRQTAQDVVPIRQITAVNEMEQAEARKPRARNDPQ